MQKKSLFWDLGLALGQRALLSNSAPTRSISHIPQKEYKIFCKNTVYTIQYFV